MTAKIKKLFRDNIITKAGMQPVEEIFAEKKLIGIYFSGQWCPPCRIFTSCLIEFYNDAKHIDENLLEIVFLSLDRSKAEFEDYYSLMPWCALRHGDPIISKLGSKFGTQGIPHLVILDPSGNIIDQNARGSVSNSKGNVLELIQQWNDAIPVNTSTVNDSSNSDCVVT